MGAQQTNRQSTEQDPMVGKMVQVTSILVVVVFSVAIFAQDGEKVCDRHQAKIPKSFRDGKVLILRLGMTKAQNEGTGIQLAVSGCDGDCNYFSKGAEIEKNGDAITLKLKDTALEKLQAKKKKLTEVVKPKLERDLRNWKQD